VCLSNYDFMDRSGFQPPCFMKVRYPESNWAQRAHREDGNRLRVGARGPGHRQHLTPGDSGGKPLFCRCSLYIGRVTCFHDGIEYARSTISDRDLSRSHSWFSTSSGCRRHTIGRRLISMGYSEGVVSLGGIELDCTMQRLARKFS